MPDDAVTEILPHDDALVIAVRNRTLNESSTRQMADDVLTAVAGRSGVPVVIDLSVVKFAPSVALGQLVQLSRSLQLDGRRIALIGIDQRIMDSIRVTNLHTVLEIHDTLDQVLRG
jgi:anti-anti-sigma factor